MKFTKVPKSSLTLENLLRRRRQTLADWIKQSGISSYEAMEERCTRMGVVPPSRSSFETIVPRGEVTSQADGIVVLPPPPDEVPEPAPPEVVVLDPPADPAPTPTLKRKRAARSPTNTGN